MDGGGCPSSFVDGPRPRLGSEERRPAGERKPNPLEVGPMPPEGVGLRVIDNRRRSLSHIPDYDVKFLKALGEIDAEYAQQVRRSGCAHCGGPLDRSDYGRKPRPELGEAAESYERRCSFCCRVDGCRKRATPPSLRFLGRKVYIGVLVIVASAAGQAERLTGRGAVRRVHGVPARTVRRWLEWWQTVFALGTYWSEAKGLFAIPVGVAELPASLRTRFGAGVAGLEKMLRFLAPVTTTSVRARMAMAM